MENNMEGEVAMMLPQVAAMNISSTSGEKSSTKDGADEVSSRVESEWEEQRRRLFPVKDESELHLCKVRSVLNKICSGNYEKLRKRWLNLIPTDQVQLTETIRLVVKKAMDEPVYMEMYAKLFGYALSKEQEDMEDMLRNDMEDMLRNTLVVHIHHCLQRLATDMEIAKYDRSVERETFARQKNVQLHRFIAVLYEEDVCTTKFVMERVMDLVGQGIRNDQEYEDVPLECLCVLLNFAGVKLEKTKGPWLNEVFLKLNLEEAVGDRSRVAKRIKFMLLDIIEMRSNDWAPHNKWWAPSMSL